MSKRGLDWYRRPEMVLADLLKGETRGSTPERILRRALVLAVDYVGGQLQNPDGSGSVRSSWPGQDEIVLPALVGPHNPRGAVKARILTDGLDRLRLDSDVRVFWPMFPIDNIGITVSPGEHVFVMFEGSGLENGIWLTRVPGHEGSGAYIGNRSYDAPSAPGSAMDHFEPNDSEYPKTEEHAALAPGKSAMDRFED